MNVSRVATRRKVGGKSRNKGYAETPSSQRWRGEGRAASIDDGHGERVGVPEWDEPPFSGDFAAPKGAAIC